MSVKINLFFFQVEIKKCFDNTFLRCYLLDVIRSELGTFECDILNSDRLINLEINNKRRTSLIYFMIKKKRRSCIDLDIRNSKVFSSELGTFEWWISGFILDLLDLLNKACSPLVINLQIK